MDQQKILLTGVTGFLGSHTAIQLLNKGYKVTGTLRNLDRVTSIKEVIGKYTGNLSFKTYRSVCLEIGYHPYRMQLIIY